MMANAYLVVRRFVDRVLLERRRRLDMMGLMGDGSKSLVFKPMCVYEISDMFNWYVMWRVGNDDVALKCMNG